MSPNRKTLEAITTEACRALFSEYGLSIGEIQAEQPCAAVQYCGIIGFTGQVARGTLLLAMEKDALAATMPPGTETTGNTTHDWIAELANQLLGRVKNQLLRRNLEIYSSIPLALHGEHISTLPRQRLVGLSFSSEAGTIRLWVDAIFEEGFTLAQQELDSDLEMPSEGEAWLF